ncbi:hypothetical protein ACI3PL_15225, partial [Lacticaseibacillus paracasei]
MSPNQLKRGFLAILESDLTNAEAFALLDCATSDARTDKERLAVQFDLTEEVARKTLGQLMRRGLVHKGKRGVFLPTQEGNEAIQSFQAGKVPQILKLTQKHRLRSKDHYFPPAIPPLPPKIQP